MDINAKIIEYVCCHLCCMINPIVDGWMCIFSPWYMWWMYVYLPTITVYLDVWCDVVWYLGRFCNAQRKWRGDSGDRFEDAATEESHTDWTLHAIQVGWKTVEITVVVGVVVVIEMLKVVWADIK